VRWQPLVIFGLSIIGFLLRIYNVNWDQGNSFQPDERQILFHVTALSWPTSVSQFLDPAKSPLNPHFFAYGSFPLYLLALVGHLLGYALADPNNFVKLTLLGRVLSALFDSGTVLLSGWLAFLLAKEHSLSAGPTWAAAFLATAFVAFTPLQLQLSHFYAVDPILVFFVTLTVLACVALVRSERPLLWSVIAGLGYGLAVATKFSALPLILPIVLAVALRYYRQRELFLSTTALLYAVLVALLCAIITQPYALLDAPNFIQQVSQQSDLARGLLDYPYVRQFVGTIPYVYELQNLVLWGMGVTLGLMALLGLLWLVWRIARWRMIDSWLIVLSWIIVYGAITDSFFTKYMRYMLPLYPFLSVIAAMTLIVFITHNGWQSMQWGKRQYPVGVALSVVLVAIVLGGTIFQGMALLNVYSQPNTRVQASLWIYQHLPPGSVLTYEQWDDALPIAVDGHNPALYTQATYQDANNQLETGLPLYDDDTTQKAQLLARLLPTINAIVMPTDRLDKSIPRSPARYPLTIHYYQLLYSGQLGFHLAAEFQVRPHLFGITLNDSSADESYSVFDHPTARIFVRDSPYPYTSQQVLQKLLAGVHLPSSSS
jgi:hypothetical protein